MHNALMHKAKFIIKWFSQFGVEGFDWPAQTLYFIPIINTFRMNWKSDCEPELIPLILHGGAAFTTSTYQFPGGNCVGVM